ncbi:MAG: hypothetical protein JWO04_2912 [Gammaproteobacteria bacterium]|nr:hypothetical protein [Gammaproteobacteria bacterium]
MPTALTQAAATCSWLSDVERMVPTLQALIRSCAFPRTSAGVRHVGEETLVDILLGFLVPTRNGELMRWCLGKGLRITQTMTLMARGLYNQPVGAWLPSVRY